MYCKTATPCMWCHHMIYEIHHWQPVAHLATLSKQVAFLLLRERVDLLCSSQDLLAPVHCACIVGFPLLL